MWRFTIAAVVALAVGDRADLTGAHRRQRPFIPVRFGAARCCRNYTSAAAVDFQLDPRQWSSTYSQSRTLRPSP